MFSLSPYAVPSLQGRHGFSLPCTMFAKNMSTVFTEPSRCELRFHREKRWKQVAPHAFLLSRCLFSLSHRLQYYSTTAHSSQLLGQVRSGQVRSGHIAHLNQQKSSTCRFPTSCHMYHYIFYKHYVLVLSRAVFLPSRKYAQGVGQL